VALIHQDYRLVPFLSLVQNLHLAAEMRGIALADQEVSELLDRVGLGGLDRSRLPGTLSGGEQQRLAIARALGSGVQVLLADEPTGALDAQNTAKIADLLAEIGAQGTTVVVATHDRAVAEKVGNCFRLVGGELISE
jgi:ABC-type lipoprotein export system ATPase subunit